ncbi:hypothetical protein GGX14DRAFT_366983, partial [Mycena pura]
RTVDRAVDEAYVMARVQTGYNFLTMTDDFTLSGDSTSRRNQNYQSHHATFCVPEMLPDGTTKLSDVPQTHFLGIRSTVNHTAEKSHESWMRSLQDVLCFWNESPLAKRKLRGMNSDHANAEKAVADLMKATKHQESLTDLAEDYLDALDLEELNTLMDEWIAKKIEDAGGQDAYDTLPKEERAARDIATYAALKQSIGETEFDKLPEAQRALTKLFIWSGCCMHKDQNSFKGGNAAMIGAYSSLGFKKPCALLNKANKEAVDVARKALFLETGTRPMSDDELTSLESASCGGSKAVALAGAVINNRYDKKGQGDTHLIYMEQQLDSVIRRFPQVNNTRFGSHGEAAGELLAHLDLYRKFLEHIRWKKQTPSWTNIELNVSKALHDPPTLTELAILALYTQVITHPYMAMVRRPESEALNAIDLGPLHNDVREHCQRLIDVPELLLDFGDKCYVDATLDGKKFTRPEVVAAVKQLHVDGQLPHLKDLLVNILRSAMETWLRFSAEYAPGGLIDGLTPDLRKRVFLNATNDRNEGALGSFVVDMRSNSSTTLATHNGMAMYTRNHTREFAKRFFTAEDQTWIMRAARDQSASGTERERRREQAEFEQRLVEMKKERHQKRQDKAAERQQLLDDTELVTDGAAIDKLTGKKLDVQIDKLKALWIKRIKLPLKGLRVEDKKIALKAAMKEHLL